jgi:FtsP/CotA-like multicopper oxidase with cupredoxin domain
LRCAYRISESSRRGFLKTAGAAALLAAVGPRLAAAADASPTALIVGRRTIEVGGRAATVYGIGQPDGRQGLEVVAGNRFRVRLSNDIADPTLVHWHGLTPPTNQDGVPELSQAPLAAGRSYDYDFLLSRSGTFWMHSHVGLQEQQLLAAPLIVASPDDAEADEQAVVIMLHDFSFRAPEEIFSTLRKGGAGAAAMSMDGGNMAGMSMGPAPADQGMSGTMAMDINDVEYDAYLANDRTLADPDVVRVEPGGRVRLRIINGAAATNFHIDLGPLQGQLIAVDGDPIAPIEGSRFELAMAQRADIRLLLPAGNGAYPILALREGGHQRTGIVLATKGASIAKIETAAAQAAPVLGLDLERRLRATNPLSARPPSRVIPVALTGNMASYQWSMNGQVYGQNQPLIVGQGERVEISLVNKTMMSHPMHLHGHHFQVVEIDGERFPGALRDTVLVPPMVNLKIAFDADNPGRWAFHCHNLYHMQAGMMTEVRYAP